MDWSLASVARLGTLVFLGILKLVLAGAGLVSPWFYVVGCLLLALAGFFGSISGWPKDNSGGGTIV
ncbi:MAG: hypothetical protein CL790_02235 [Chloroflexi bacterium]|nr:hypothetical protein [Chloroflexota bacterium]